MRIGSLFSGYGGLDMGVQAVLGGSVAWHVEIDKDASRILEHHWPDVPNLGDISAVDWAQVEPVDVLTGGFPCQDVSHAGKRAGIAPGTRSGLWSEFARAIQALRPELVVIENVRGLLSARADRGDDVGDVGCGLCDVEDPGQPALRALGAVLGDLAELGYDARWGGVRAADAGAPHGRFRVFIIASPDPGHAACPGSGLGLQGAPPRTTGRADRVPPADATWRDESQQPQGDGGRAAMDGAESRTGYRDSTGSAAARVPVVGRSAGVEWGPYAAAVHRWERVLAQPAPPPTDVGAKGQPRLSPRFVEWMMGLPGGHVTDVDISRNAMLKALGNGVVPQQAELALGVLLHADTLPTLPTLPTPVSDNSRGLPQPGTDYQSLPNTVAALLPTPAVNDMGAGKTVDEWDSWTDRMKAEHGNGNGHGKSLAIEAQRIGGDTA